MKTIVKLLIALSVTVNPVALLADGLPGTVFQIAPSSLSGQHQGQSHGQKADSAGPGSAVHMSPCSGHGMCKLQKNHGCSLHHHPAFVATDGTIYPVTTAHPVVFGLNARMSSHEFQPETPPPKYL